MLIDTHVHLTEMLGFYMTEDMVYEMMDRYDISYIILSNGDSAEYDHDLKPIPLDRQISQKDSFQRSIRFARAHSGRVGIMPWIKPAGETADREFCRMVEENLDIVKGIKMHAFHSKTPADSPKMVPYAELAFRYHLPVAVHTGGCEEASPEHVYQMAKRYPEVDFIMVHMGLGTDNREAIELMAQADNLIADTTWVPLETTVEVIRRYGSRRIVFGSDSPIDGVDTYRFNRSGEPSMYRRYFNELEDMIGEEAYKNLMFRNAVRIFNITDLNIE